MNFRLILGSAFALACAPKAATIPLTLAPSVDASVDSADLILVSAYVSPREFSGTVGAQAGFSRFVEGIALSGKPIIVLSFGSPYLLSAFPSVSSYLLAWGGSPVSQRAAALAILGEREINGRLPISLPPALPFGAGIHRAPTGMSNK